MPVMRNFDIVFVVNLNQMLNVAYYRIAGDLRRHDAYVTLLYCTRYIDGLVQERRNSIALAMELRLSCINPSICIVIAGQWDWEVGRWGRPYWPFFDPCRISITFAKSKFGLLSSFSHITNFDPHHIPIYVFGHKFSRDK